MRIQIKPSRGEFLRMKVREALFYTNTELHAAWSAYMMLQGEMALVYCEQDINVLEDKRWQLTHALHGQHLRKGELP